MSMDKLPGDVRTSDPGGHGHWYFQWFTVLLPAATVPPGAAYRAYAKRSPSVR
ncbi:hypothetical protein AB0I52_20495 [Streptomyces sp. NPDC050423]|uniref:hypothetical protein n=1 Tax=Streptomyces sp. NPDC050423 TaxID=3155402 RepID=UPI0034346B55